MTPEALEKVNAAIATARERLAELDEDLAKARKAGIPVGDVAARAVALRTQIEMMEKVYGMALQGSSMAVDVYYGRTQQGLKLRSAVKIHWPECNASATNLYTFTNVCEDIDWLGFGDRFLSWFLDTAELDYCEPYEEAPPRMTDIGLHYQVQVVIEPSGFSTVPAGIKVFKNVTPATAYQVGSAILNYIFTFHANCDTEESIEGTQPEEEEEFTEQESGTEEPEREEDEWWRKPPPDDDVIVIGDFTIEKGIELELAEEIVKETLNIVEWAGLKAMNAISSADKILNWGILGDHSIFDVKEATSCANAKSEDMAGAISWDTTFEECLKRIENRASITPQQVSRRSRSYGIPGGEERDMAEGDVITAIETAQGEILLDNAEIGSKVTNEVIALANLIRAEHESTRFRASQAVNYAVQTIKHDLTVHVSNIMDGIIDSYNDTVEHLRTMSGGIRKFVDKTSDLVVDALEESFGGVSGAVTDLMAGWQDFLWKTIKMVSVEVVELLLQVMGEKRESGT